ncbi:SGNH hydrolase-type esterase domain-containing protein [Xylogone sp. PMI_703]|nr:SGNH hydrolase-type esterase domain-containing protein [Xylogone sp. PMI_703]
MVGSLVDGDPETSHNCQHEGHKGYIVNQMIEVADNTIPRKPNVVLINYGTNDADPINNQSISGTGERMRALIDHLYANIADVTIILCTLLPRKDAANQNITIINPQYRSLA